MLVVPDAALLPAAADDPKDTSGPKPTHSDAFSDVAQAMLTQAYNRKDRFAILDVWGTDQLDPLKPGFLGIVRDFTEEYRGKIMPAVEDMLKYGAVYFPFLKTSIVDPGELDFQNFNLTGGPLPAPTPAASAGAAGAAGAAGSSGSQTPPAKAPQATKDVLIAALTAAATASYDAATAGKLSDKFLKPMLQPGLLSSAITHINQGLIQNYPDLQPIFDVMAADQGLLPPSGAMAGLYCKNDTDRGVWNAPANMALQSVTAPTIRVSDAMQGDLNVPLDGLAINAIREFPGRGILVWGARTLYGNSRDWRYIQIRRTLIYIEQSVNIALNQYVFDANVEQTWVAVTAMISSFLTDLWTRGGLMGATAQEAFSVQCGKGVTMTPMDILDGKMIVQIKVQMVHPAEFILLTFQQEMQGGGS